MLSSIRKNYVCIRAYFCSWRVVYLANSLSYLVIANLSPKNAHFALRTRSEAVGNSFGCPCSFSTDGEIDLHMMASYAVDA